ncbi:MAG: CRISPR system precrRNA processing endoribonuclease RAMP protein Cas6 [Chloroflexota bacterium]
MPLSIIVQLEAAQAGRLEQFTGRGVHGFWFKRWKDVDPALGDALHTESDVQSFTLSPLMGLPRPERGAVRITPGLAAHFRVTALADGLAEAVKSKWMAGLAESGPVALPGPTETGAGPGSRSAPTGELTWRVIRAEVEAETGYEALSKSHLMASVPPRQWTLDFVTPTTFHGAGSHLPFPLPDSLAGSWLRRWNAFAPIALPKDDLLEWARAKLVVSSYHLRTLPAREGERLRVGCVGRLGLRALEMPPYLRAALDLLAHYAFYCGSGSHTGQGLVQTRVK